MNGEHLEYGIQRKRHGKWLAPVITEGLKDVRSRYKILQRAYPKIKYRIVIRTVSDWCEMFQGENKDEKQV